MHYSQPDYIFARKRDVRRFRNVGFRWPQYHDLGSPSCHRDHSHREDTDGEIRVAVAELTNGPSAGVLLMRAENL